MTATVLFLSPSISVSTTSSAKNRLLAAGSHSCKRNVAQLDASRPIPISRLVRFMAAEKNLDERKTLATETMRSRFLRARRVASADFQHSFQSTRLEAIVTRSDWPRRKCSWATMACNWREMRGLNKGHVRGRATRSVKSQAKGNKLCCRRNIL